MRLKTLFATLFLLHSFLDGNAQKKKFSYMDLFDLQYASDPRISPNGEWVVYRRMGMDVMKDKAIGHLWMVKVDGSGHQKLTSRETVESSPRWSPKGDKLAFVSSTDEGSEIYLYWFDSGKIAQDFATSVQSKFVDVVA